MQLVFALIVATAHAFAGSAEDYHIGPGDVLDVTVHGHDFGKKEFLVGASGEVSLPYVGKVSVASQTVFQAESTLETALSDGFLVDPQVTIQVSDYRSQRVDVLGAVGKPGAYYLEGATSVREIVAKSGGTRLERSNGKVVVRRASETFEFTVDDLQTGAGDFALAPGDVVDVTEGSFVYLTGEVNKPGAITFTDGITASQALIRAGGGSDFSRLAGSYVLRDGERISVNLRRVLRGKDADILLEPGDQLVIPESPL